MTRYIAALPQPAEPMPAMTPEQRRAEVEAIAAQIRAACEGSALRMENLFRYYASEVRRG